MFNSRIPEIDIFELGAIPLDLGGLSGAGGTHVTSKLFFNDYGPQAAG
jgi:hypothetical protein